MDFGPPTAPAAFRGMTFGFILRSDLLFLWGSRGTPLRLHNGAILIPFFILRQRCQVQIQIKVLSHLLKNSQLQSLAESRIDPPIRTITLRKIPPRCPAAKNSDHPVKHLPVICTGTATLTRT